jgi:dihydroorotase
VIRRSAGNWLVKGGRLVDPLLGIDAVRDVRITGGIVSEIGEHLDARDGERTFDATNAVVAPGFIDMHVHLREPGYSHKETVETGTLAAVRGGFTSVACMPNTDPALDAREIVSSFLQSVSRRAQCRVYPIGAMTVGRAGQVPCDYAALSAAGAVAFSDDGDTVASARVLRHAAIAAADVPGRFISHCEDVEIKHGRWPGPPVAEEIAVARDLLIARETQKAWHIAHISTHVALEIVRFMRSLDTRVTCEAAPHHLHFTSDAVPELGAAAKVNPPLRSEQDVRALRMGVRDGTIDALASDHAPHTQAEKSGDLAQAAVGFSGLEIAIGAYAAALPELPMRRFVELLSANPARILGVRGGTLAVGSAADVTVLADRDWTVDPSTFASKGTCTPFAGRVLPRCALATFVGGELRYDRQRDSRYGSANA